MHINRYVGRSSFKAVALLAIATAAPVLAAPAVRQPYHLPAQDLGTALRDVARISHRQIMFAAAAVNGKQAPRLDGNYDPTEAVTRLLAGSGLFVVNDGDLILIREDRGQASASDASDPKDATDIVVTGSRIRGAPIASPVIVLTQKSITDAGQTSVADAVRDIPQNFSGGQNPGVVVGAGGSPDNANVGSGSTINLRGIGQAATLTLLNGHRLAYDINSQGIDVSVVPLAALDRIEVVADGASALYGSDAVAGVANIILKSDFDGLTSSARFGAATDGGDFEQQYSLVAGRRWSSGGVIATYDFGRDTAITAGQRSYTTTLNPADTLLPYQRHHSAILSGHQDIAPNLAVSIDGTFNKRWSSVSFAVAPTGSYQDFGVLLTSNSTSFSVAPSIKWHVGGRWNLALTGVYAQDHAHYVADLYLGGAVIAPNEGCYCNSFKSIEASAEGPLIRLPAGDARAAVGGGYRSNTLRAFRTAGTPQDVDVTQGVYYAYGELAVPVVGPGQTVPLIHRLSLSAALRYEDYPGVARVTTPKLGIIYAPASWIDIKGSWGRSFKAPTLYQQYSAQGSTLYPASALGGVGLPVAATVVELSGANPGLKPERATTWTATLAVHTIKNFEAQISYFNIDYRDRVVQPIPRNAGALTNPSYRALIDFAPSDAAKAAAVDDTVYIFDNQTAGAVDLAAITAIVDNRYRNIARQKIDGIDAAIRFRHATGTQGTFTVDASGTYLRSRQILAPGQPAVALAGTIFNPPHFRVRGGGAWERGHFTLSSFANYIGDVRDTRSPASPRVGSVTTLDLTAHYRFSETSGVLHGVDIVGSVQNVFNAKPDQIATNAPYFPPYDSTNYSAIGRFLSLTVSKAW